MNPVNATLDALEKELEFLDRGGYRLAAGWAPPLIFEDSPICPKPPYSPCAVTWCALMHFVPAERRAEDVPCRHIPLNEVGETLHTLYHTATMEEIENTLRQWLRTEIKELHRKHGMNEEP